MKAKYLFLSIFTFLLSEGLFSQINTDFFYEVTGNEFLNVNFLDNSSSSEDIDTWQWDFGDGSDLISEINPIHLYAIEGSYRVVLYITTASYSDSSVQYVSVGEDYYLGDICLSAFSFNEFGNDGLGFQFFDDSYIPEGSIETYLWDFGDGTTSSETNPIKSYSEEGEYEVTLTITANECNSTFTSFIFAGTNNWYPDECQSLFWFTTNPSNYREYRFSDFSYGNNEILFWHWEFGDGEISTQPNPNHIYEIDGVYETSLTIITETCESTFLLELNIFENSQAGDSLMPLFYPNAEGNLVHFYNLTRGDVESWEWDFGDGTNSTLQSPEHSFDEPGIHEVSLSAYNEDIVNTIVIRFEMSFLKDDNSNKGIDYAYFYPGGLTSLNTINSLSFSIYPNPANDILTIKTLSEKPIIKIYNITGKIMLEKEVLNSKISIKELPAGLYIIKVIDKDISGTIKFIKK